MPDTSLIVQDTQHFTLSDQLTLSPNYLTVHNAAHVHKTDNIILDGVDTILTVANAAHVLIDIPPTLRVALVVANAAHAHTVETPTLVQLTNLIVANTVHALTSDEIAALLSNTTLTLGNGAHAHTAESPSLIPNTTLAVANAAHAHTVEGVVVIEVPAEVTEFFTPIIDFTGTKPTITFTGKSVGE